jgi:hypothetical protein
VSIGEEIIEGLTEFRDQLKRGERIVVTQISRCDCNPGNVTRAGFDTGNPQCHLCGGRGWLTTAKTLFPKESP